MAGYPDFFKVNHGTNDSDLISAIGKGFTPGIDDQRVAIACAAALDFAYGAGSNDKSPVFYRPRSIKHMPMGFSGLFCKCGWNKEDFGA